MITITKKAFLFVTLMSMTILSNSQLPFFKTSQNIGFPALPGKSVYNSENQSYEISGGGTNMWFDKDEFFFQYRPVNTDFILTSKVDILTKTGDPHRKIGLMIRQSMDAASVYADVVLHADGLLSLQYRTKQGGITEEIRFAEVSAQYLQLEKKGSKILARIAQNEKALTSAKEIEIQFEAPFYVGLLACSQDRKSVV